MCHHFGSRADTTPGFTMTGLFDGLGLESSSVADCGYVWVRLISIIETLMGGWVD